MQSPAERAFLAQCASMGVALDCARTSDALAGYDDDQLFAAVVELPVPRDVNPQNLAVAMLRPAYEPKLRPLLVDVSRLPAL